MRKYQFAILCLVLIMSLALVSGCLKKDLPAPLPLPLENGSLNIVLNLPDDVLTQFVDYDMTISEIVVSVYNNEQNFSRTIDLSGVEQGVNFTDLEVGTWNITASAKDSEGFDIFSGSASATVDAFDVTSVTVELSLKGGELEIEVIFPTGVDVGSGTVTLIDPIDETKKIEQSLVLGTTSGTATFTDVRPTTWPLWVKLYDGASALVASGKGYVDFLPGRTTVAEAQVSTNDGMDISFSWDCPPLAPMGLAGYRVSGSDVFLSWNANYEENIYGYLIYRSESEIGKKTLLNLHAITETTFTDVSSTYDATYWYWVQAINDQGYSSNLSEPITIEANGAPNYTVVYSIGSVIHSMKLDGTDFVALTDETAVNRTPVISADKSKVHYINISPFTSARRFMTMNIDGTNKTQTVIPIAEMCYWFSSFAWSQDDSKVVAIFSDQEYDNFNLYMLNADGTNFHRVTNFTNNVYMQHIKWSPDGNSIIYELFDMDSEESNRGDLYIVDLSTGESRQLVECNGLFYGDEVQGQWIRYINATWSQDGTKVYYLDRIEPLTSSFGLYVVNADGTNKQAIYTDMNIYRFAISPDENYIAFADRYYLYTMHSDGSHLTKIHTGSVEEIQWSPDGSHLIVSGAIDGEWSMFRIKADGTGLTRLTSDNDMVYNINVF